jgi:hypothetical protein
MMNPLTDFAIRYDDLSEYVIGQEGEFVSVLTETLVDTWIDHYHDMISHEPYILDVPDRGFNFLFDLTLAKHDKNDPNRPDDRVVAAYGLSRAPEANRDASRIRGFGKIGVDKGATDKGHLMAHSMGGSLDINVFPQSPDVNRGRSAEGRRYRAMERYAAKHPGTFVFSRLIYGDDSWVPRAVEYGILLPERAWWIDRFPN